MFRSRAAVVGLCAAFVAVASAPRLARADEKLDLSYVSGDAITAVVLHPARLLAAPEIEMLPIEVVVAASVENLGIDPTEIELAIGILGLSGLPQGQPGLGAVLHFSKPYDKAAVIDKLGNGTQEASVAGKTIYDATAPGGFSLYLPDNKTLVIGTPQQLRSMLKADKPDSALVKLLKQADTSKAAVAVLDFAAVRPLVLLGMQNMPPVPEQFKDFLELPRLLQWIQVSADLKDGFSLEVVLGAADAKGAKSLKDLGEKAKMLARQFIETQLPAVLGSGGPGGATEEAMVKYMRRLGNKLLDSIEIKVVDDKVKIDLANGTPTIATTGVLVALLLPAVQAAREAARRNMSSNQLRQIALAMLNHEAAFKRYPPRAIVDKQGKPLLSWRVKILPFIEEQALYNEFHLDEPWDSEHNRKLIARMPSVYANPNLPNNDGKTVYLAVVGAGTVFEGTEGLSIRKIIDGTSNTVLAVEADADRAVVWTKPDDYEVDANQPLAGLGHLRPGGFSAVFGDGHISFIANGIDPDLWRALITYAGREAVRLPE